MTERRLPAAARKLVDLAEANEWVTGVQWQTNHWDETFVHVHVGRRATAEEIRAFREDHRWGERWEFQALWHSRNATRPGGLNLFGRVLGNTPEIPRDAEYSLKEVRDIIAANPHSTPPDDDTTRHTETDTET